MFKPELLDGEEAAGGEGEANGEEAAGGEGEAGANGEEAAGVYSLSMPRFANVCQALEIFASVEGRR